MTSDQDTKVVAEPQVQQVQEVKDGSHLVSILIACSPGVLQETLCFHYVLIKIVGKNILEDSWLTESIESLNSQSRAVIGG